MTDKSSIAAVRGGHSATAGVEQTPSARATHVATPRPAMPYEIPVYKGLVTQAFPEVHEKVAEIVQARMPAASRVLDLAAGQGALSQRLMDLGYTVACTSWNERLKIAPSSVFRINLDRAFGTDDVGGSRYPCVLAVEIIEHLRNPFQFLSSVRTVLADDGCVVLTTPNIQSALSRLQVLRRGTPHTFSDEEIISNRHIFMPHPTVLALFLRQVGLQIVERHFVPDERIFFHGASGLAKSLLTALVNALGTGDLSGAARIYVLKKTDPAPEDQGEIY
jgi:hypothetical protein